MGKVPESSAAVKSTDITPKLEERHRTVAKNLFRARFDGMLQADPDAFALALQKFVEENEDWIRKHGGDDHPLLDLLTAPRF